MTLEIEDYVLFGKKEARSWVISFIEGYTGNKYLLHHDPLFLEMIDKIDEHKVKLSTLMNASYSLYDTYRRPSREYSILFQLRKRLKQFGERFSSSTLLPWGYDEDLRTYIDKEIVSPESPLSDDFKKILRKRWYSVKLVYTTLINFYPNSHETWALIRKVRAYMTSLYRNEWRENNKKRIRGYRRKWRENNKDKVREYQRRWYSRIPDSWSVNGTPLEKELPVE